MFVDINLIHIKNLLDFYYEHYTERIRGNNNINYSYRKITIEKCKQFNNFKLKNLDIDS